MGENSILPLHGNVVPNCCRTATHKGYGSNSCNQKVMCLSLIHYMQGTGENIHHGEPSVTSLRNLEGSSDTDFPILYLQNQGGDKQPADYINLTIIKIVHGYVPLNQSDSWISSHGDSNSACAHLNVNGDIHVKSKHGGKSHQVN